jgi:DNA primase
MTDFSRQDLEALKAQVDLAAVMRSHGIDLETVGRNLKALCPWHEDKDASLVVNPEKGLYNCFGCQARGDVLSFIQDRENLSFPQAVTRLRELAGVTEAGAPAFAPAKGDPDRFPGGLTRDGLLGKVLAHYQSGLARSPEAREYLEGRKLWDTEMIHAFRLGYCDGSLLATLPQTGPIREAMTTLGVLNSKGKEHFLGCVVAPLEHPNAGIVGLYGRRLNLKAKVRHLFLPGPKRGILGLDGLSGASALTLAEGVFDALSLWIAGTRPVTAIYGTAGLTEDLEHFLRASSVRELRLCFDADRAGDEAVERIVDQVGDRFRLSRVVLPDGCDPNDLLSREAPEILREFAQCLQPVPGGVGESESLDDDEIPITETTEIGFTLEFSEVRYEVTPAPPYSGRLKVSIRAERFQGPEGMDTTRKKPKFLDRCDLVSARSRSETLRGMSQRLYLDREEAERHLRAILDTAEEWVTAIGGSLSGGNEHEPAKLSEAQKATALEFLREPELVRLLLNDIEVLGHVGEEKGKLLGYLVGISRKLENPLSAIIRSQSGAGKSGLARAIAMLVPPEDVIHYSRVSAHALAYAGKDAYKCKLILMEERTGGEAADYYIRILQSSHVIRQAVVIKDPVTGQMRTQEFEVEGPIAYIETTTDAQLNPENASRCFEIFLDESEAQTHRIQARQRQARASVRLQSVNRQAIIERHHNAQRMLKAVMVVIPYVEHLSFPTRWLRTRRDNERFLCLIEASAFLHQHQRPRKAVTGPDGETSYVEATLDDYRLAYELAKDVLRDCLHELSPSARELLEIARNLQADQFTRRELRESTGWAQRRVIETTDELVAMEYLTATSGSQGKTYLYSLAKGNGSQPSPVSSLLRPEELELRLRDTG